MSHSHNDQHLYSSGCSLNDEISAVNSLLSIVTLTSPDDWLCAPPLPTLPLDIVEEIFSRLPVKLLLQLRCVCKRWNSLISDPKFAKKHLCHSTTLRFHFLSYVDQSNKNILTSYPIDSLFTNEVTTGVTQLEYPPHNIDEDNDPLEFYDYIVGSCNGILCLRDYRDGFVLMCNPSLGKFKELPRLQIPRVLYPYQMPYVLNQADLTYGFGYDHVNDNYKVVVMMNYYVRESIGNTVGKTEVKVHTLGTSFWKNVQQEFPFCGLPIKESGTFVSDTINWLLAFTDPTGWSNPCFIVSFDLENESFQEVPKPEYGNVENNLVNLNVLRDCLCMICEHDIWLMKEYRNKESWTKLFTVSYMQDPSKSYELEKAIYIFEDDQVLLESYWDSDTKSIVYDPKINTFKFTKFQNKDTYDTSGKGHGQEVSVESLILPWS